MHAQCLRNMRTLKANTARLLLKICVVINFIKRIYAGPPEYCLQSLNRSECNLMPIKVFTYYKPGSRCELMEWRGCPTYNRFDTEENCINICINSYYIHDTSKTGLYSGAVKTQCVKPFIIYNCSNNATKAFVYNKATNDCDEIIWTGCPHIGNVFEEKLDCLQTCYRGNLNWNKKIKMLSNKIANHLAKMLNSILFEVSDATPNLINTNHVTESEKKVNKKQSGYNTDEVNKKQNIVTEKTLKFTSNGPTNTPVTKINNEDDYDKALSTSEKINEINSKASFIDMNTETTNYISTIDYDKIKTSNVNEEGDITATKVTRFESPTVENPNTDKVTTTDMTTEAKLTTTTVTRRRRRTYGTSIGTAKEVVFPEDVK